LPPAVVGPFQRVDRARAAGHWRGQASLRPERRQGMRGLFALLVVVVIAVAAVGFYRGWFSVAWDKTDNGGQVTGTVDKDKIEADKKRAAEEVHRLGESKANARTASTKE